jgi:hypothetical protein
LKNVTLVRRIQAMAPSLCILIKMDERGEEEEEERRKKYL